MAHLIKLVRPPSAWEKAAGYVGMTRHTLWRLGVTIKAENPKGELYLCSPSVIHAYETLPQAMYFRDSHSYSHLSLPFVAGGKIAVRDHEKVGCRQLTLLEPTSFPEWFTNISNDDGRESFRRAVNAEVLRYCMIAEGIMPGSAIDLVTDCLRNDGWISLAVREVFQSNLFSLRDVFGELAVLGGPCHLNNLATLMSRTTFLDLLEEEVEKCNSST